MGDCIVGEDFQGKEFKREFFGQRRLREGSVNGDFYHRFFFSLFSSSRISTLIDSPSHPHILTIPTIPTIPTSHTNPLTFIPVLYPSVLAGTIIPITIILITIITIVTFRSFFLLFFPHNRSAKNLRQMIKHLPSSASPLFVPSPPHINCIPSSAPPSS